METMHDKGGKTDSLRSKQRGHSYKIASCTWSPQSSDRKLDYTVKLNKTS